MNREGRTYRSDRVAANGFVAFPEDLGQNGSVVVVTRSTPWSPERPDTSNFTHQALVLECPLDPSLIGRGLGDDERFYVRGGVRYSTFVEDDLWKEI